MHKYAFLRVKEGNHVVLQFIPFGFKILYEGLQLQISMLVYDCGHVVDKFFLCGDVKGN